MVDLGHRSTSAGGSRSSTPGHRRRGHRSQAPRRLGGAIEGRLCRVRGSLGRIGAAGEARSYGSGNRGRQLDGDAAGIAWVEGHRRRGCYASAGARRRRGRSVGRPPVRQGRSFVGLRVSVAGPLSPQKLHQEVSCGSGQPQTRWISLVASLAGLWLATTRPTCKPICD